MSESFAEMLAVGGKSNSLGRANEVIDAVLSDKEQLEELYRCLFDEDAWVRMRAADALEKVCRVHPKWLEPYVDRFATDLAPSTQPSIQWHLAEMYGEVNLTNKQRAVAIKWLQQLLATTDVDWIVAANSMKTLSQFARDGFVSQSKVRKSLELQRRHKSKAVVRRADTLLKELHEA